MGTEGRDVVWEGRFLRTVVEGAWEFSERKGVQGAVAIIPLTGEGEVVLVEQHRIPVGGRVVELPAGLVGDERGREDEPFEVAAERELLEETGFVAAHLEEVATGVVSAGMSDERLVVYLARGCTRVGPGGGDKDEDIEVHQIPIDDAPRWLREKQAAGVLVDVKVLIALHFGATALLPTD